ncbi:MAG: hypothetical protein LC774_15410 [Acidobacteria bacterium]|nr:hypothetical protein [Acidobacteriota bacterium]
MRDHQRLARKFDEARGEGGEQSGKFFRRVVRAEDAEADASGRDISCGGQRRDDLGFPGERVGQAAELFVEVREIEIDFDERGARAFADDPRQALTLSRVEQRRELAAQRAERGGRFVSGFVRLASRAAARRGFAQPPDGLFGRGRVLAARGRRDE